LADACDKTDKSLYPIFKKGSWKKKLVLFYILPVYSFE